MPTFKFVCEHRDFHTYDLDSKTTLETNKESLYDVIEEFERFLKGAGFVFDGQLDIVDNDSVKQESVDSFKYVTQEDINNWTENYTIANSDALFCDPFADYDYNVGNIEYLGNLDFSGNNDFIIQSSSTAWPFPQNERP